MTDYVAWFRYQLKASADGFAWAVSQIPQKFLEMVPPDPDYLGTWPPLRHVWHVTEYERCLVIPSMLEWLGVSTPDEDWLDDDAGWEIARQRGVESLLMEFQNVRQNQIDLLDQLMVVDWTQPRETLWGQKPLSMVVTKTFQHTYEHGDTLLRMGLWWEVILEEEARKAAGAES